MAIAYPNRHYRESDERHAAKRAANATIDKTIFFNTMGYHKKLAPTGRIFKDEGEYLAALEDGWTDSPTFEMSPKQAAVLKAMQDDQKKRLEKEKKDDKAKKDK